MKQKLKVEKIGGSLVIIIPKYFKDLYDIKEGQLLEINLDMGSKK